MAYLNTKRKSLFVLQSVGRECATKSMHLLRCRLTKWDPEVNTGFSGCGASITRKIAVRGTGLRWTACKNRIRAETDLPDRDNTNHRFDV
jgi:hypothetical protein